MQFPPSFFCHVVVVATVVSFASMCCAATNLPAEKNSGTGGITVTGVTETTTYNPPGSRTNVNEPPLPLARPAGVRVDDVTRLVVDKDKNTVAILIKGKQVGLFDSEGLHVTGSIDYTGQIVAVPPQSARIK